MAAHHHQHESRNDTSLFSLEFDELVGQTLEKWKVPSISIAVIQGETTSAKGYGIASYPSTPATPETLYYAGSTTKAFTAAALSLLVDDNEKYPGVQWTTPISSLIPDDFVLSDPYWTDHITLEDALCHRTGMPRHDSSYGGHGWTVRDVVQNMRHLPLSRTPRTEFQYCNIMYIALSHAIEVLTGEPLGDFLAQRIWRPLSMHSTFFTPSDAQKSANPLATGYHWNRDGFKPLPWAAMPEISGAGAMISNVLDLAKWTRCMLSQACPPISASAHDALVRPRMPFDNGLLPDAMPAFFYGLGWRVTWYRGQRVVWHTGGVKGFGAVVLYVPGRAWGCVMLGNTEESSNKAQKKLAWWLVDELLRVPRAERFDWDEHHGTLQREEDALFSSARERLYPDTDTLTDTPRPHSLPLEAYTGTFSHRGYQSITLSIISKPSSSSSSSAASSSTSTPTLHASVTDRRLPFTLELEHVSDEHFVAYARWPDTDEKTATRAEFRIRADDDGTCQVVEAMVLGFQHDVSVDVVVFRRV